MRKDDAGPAGSGAAPDGGAAGPERGGTAPAGGPPGPETGGTTPAGGPPAPETGGTTPAGGPPAPETGGTAPEGPPPGEWDLPWAEPFGTGDPERARLAAAFGAALRQSGALMQLMGQAAADRIGINATDLNCLNILSFRGQMTAGELARATGLTTASITGVVDRLEEAGYVRRERDRRDRRRVVIQLVLETAMRDVASVFRPMMRDWQQMAAQYTDDELRLIVGFYGRLEVVLRSHLTRLRESPRDG
jgi:DNA-binding MarR family transcriptional regulator